MEEDENSSGVTYSPLRLRPRAIWGAVLVVVVILLFTVGSWHLAGVSGMQFAGVVISGLLTAALVGLYFHQTRLLEDQIDLRTQEINREVRQHHTETLRERIYAWLGTDEIPRTTESVKDMIQSSGEQLPKVTAADVEPAESYTYSFGSPEEFRVVPLDLERDRYFIDLLENHAPELESRREEINRLYAEFVDRREQFLDSFEVVSFTEKGLRSDPGYHLGQWVFKGAVKIERGRIEDWDEEIKPAMRAFKDRTSTAVGPDELKLTKNKHDGRPLYRIVSEETSLEDAPDGAAEALAEKSVRKAVGGLHVDEEPYRYAAEAADLLDSIEEEIRELRMELIEYAGRPIFRGDCEYIDEATLDQAEQSEQPS